MEGTRVGYARCSTDEQDVEVQVEQLTVLGVTEDRIYIDRGFSGTRRDNRAGQPMTKDLVTVERSQRALSRFAHGYLPQADRSLKDFFTAYGAKGIPTDLYGLPFGDGAFAGTALGAAQHLDGLFARNRLLRPATVREMTTPTPQAVESPAFGGTYGMGTSRDVVSGRTWQGHGGSYVGFNSMGATDIERGVTIVVMTNQYNRETQDRRPADEMWRAVADAYASGTG